jgi:hypothetical protein
MPSACKIWAKIWSKLFKKDSIKSLFALQKAKIYKIGFKNANRLNFPQKLYWFECVNSLYTWTTEEVWPNPSNNVQSGKKVLAMPTMKKWHRQLDWAVFRTNFWWGTSGSRFAHFKEFFLISHFTSNDLGGATEFFGFRSTKLESLDPELVETLRAGRLFKWEWHA